MLSLKAINNSICFLVVERLHYIPRQTERGREKEKKKREREERKRRGQDEKAARKKARSEREGRKEKREKISRLSHGGRNLKAV